MIRFLATSLVWLLICSKALACNQSCGYGSTAKQVPYPFGFSEGCPIQLNCTGNGIILIDEFVVESLDQDGDIRVSVPANCDRSIDSLRHLFGPNYSPTAHNAILFRNCSQPITGCLIPTTTVQTNFELLDCGSSLVKGDNISCYSETDKSREFTVYDDMADNGCGVWFSSISVEGGGEEAVSLGVQVVKLGWWVEGECDDVCGSGKGATCDTVLSPMNGQSAVRCKCKDGYTGDGFRAGKGCWKGPPLPGGNKNRTQLIFILTTVAGVIFLVTIVLVLYKFKGNRKAMTRIGGVLRDVHNNHMTRMESSELPMLDFVTLAVATQNFSETNKLGAGGFGPVYRGKLEDGKEIAVKRLSSHSGQGGVEFKNEILLISKLQHRNLVRLLGFCIEGDEKLLVYEYLKNKSLDTLLFDTDTSKKVELNWSKRFGIIVGIARGLLYLHRDSCMRIIHRDLKAGNILLDDNMNPKISDFGLARAFDITQELTNTHRVVGTFGYISPEYAVGGLFSEKSDVFSFGILVLEILAGMRVSSFSFQEEYLNLQGHAWHLWNQGKGLTFMDKQLYVPYPGTEFLKCLQIGLLCVQYHAKDRPNMSSVVLMLTSDTNIPRPKEPTLCQGLLGTGLNSNNLFSTNDLSNSMVEGR